MASLKDLDAAIYVRIMRFLPSLQTIFLLVASCRPALLAFKNNEALVLCQYLLDFFDINLCDAMHVLMVPAPNFPADIRPNPNGPGQDSVWSSKVLEFSKRCLNNTPQGRDQLVARWLQSQYTPGGFDRPFVSSLCRLATTVDSLLRPYWAFSQKSAQRLVPVFAQVSALGRPKTLSGYTGRSPDEPSPTERHRLVRAIIRFEIMCRLFTIPFWQILTATTSMQDLSPAQIIGRLEGIAKNDWTSEGFLLLMEENEAEQILSVGAFVRAQYRSMIAVLRKAFENHCLAESITFAQRKAQGLVDPESAMPLIMIFEDKKLIRETSSGIVWSLQYLRGRPEGPTTPGGGGKENTWIDNLASGFGLALLSRLLRAPSAQRRRDLLTIISAIEAPRDALETNTAYTFHFAHTRSFPVLPHNNPAFDAEGRRKRIIIKTKSGSDSDSSDLGLDKPKMRMIGCEFWDSARIQSPLFTTLETEWLPIVTEPPHEPFAKEQLTPGPAWETAVFSFDEFVQQARYVWVERHPRAEPGRMDQRRVEKLSTIIHSVTRDAGY